MFSGTYTHLEDMLASQYQSIDWTQHTTCKLQAAFSWRNLLVPGTMYEKNSQETNHDLDSCFDFQEGLSADLRATTPMNEHQ